MRRLSFIALMLFCAVGYAQFPMVGSGRQVYRPDQVDSLFYWFDASVGVTESGGAVSAWADQSGNGYDVSQGTTARKPTYSASGGLNNAPYITFDGVNDFLFRSNIFWGADDLTIFAVIYNDQTSADTNDVIIGHYCSNCTDRQWILGWSSALYFAKLADGSTYTDARAGVSKSADWKIMTISAGVGLEVNKNGGVVQITDDSYAASIYNNTDSLVIGMFPSENSNPDIISAAGNFSVSEIIVYSRALTNAERQGIEAYLSSKYDLALQNKQKPPVISNRRIQPDYVDSLFYWFDASDAATLQDSLGGAIADNEGVGTWLDKSGRDYDVTQTTNTARPVYKSTGGPGGNTPALQFDGSNDFLASAAHWWGSDDLTVFVVMKFGNATRDAVETILRKGESVDNTRQIYYIGRQASNSYALQFTVHQDGGATNLRAHTFSSKSTSYRSIIFQSNGIGGVQSYVDNASNSITSSGAGDESILNNSTYGLDIGVANSQNTAVNFLQGSISEIIVYSRALTHEERRGIEAYLIEKWGL